MCFKSPIFQDGDVAQWYSVRFACERPRFDPRHLHLIFFHYIFFPYNIVVCFSLLNLTNCRNKWMVITLSSFKKAALCTPKQSAYPRACCVSCSLCIRKTASYFSHTFNFRAWKFWRWCNFISAELDPINLQQFFTSLLFVFSCHLFSPMKPV